MLTGNFPNVIPLKDKFYEQPETIQTRLAPLMGLKLHSEQELKIIDRPAGFEQLNSTK